MAAPPLFRAALVASLPVLCVLLAGCGEKEENLVLVPVAGKVAIDRTPMPSGVVTFFPDDSKGNKAKKVPSGTIQSDGTYKLQTDQKDGAPVGWYKVTVVPSNYAAAGAPPVKAPPPYFSDFQSLAKTPLVIEVKESAPAGAYDIKLH
jgi:hypothetical protein